MRSVETVLALVVLATVVATFAKRLTARIAQRRLALAVAVWHNRATGQPVT